MASLRRLALHASALSDAEYELYTSSLKDIALGDEDEEEQSGNGRGVGGSGKAKGGAARTGGVEHGDGQGNEVDSDAYFEDMKIGVREVRAWLRGRYSHVSSSAIDKILRLFSPTIAHGDVLSGSAFFAALRLVVHAENGEDVERSLAFVQAVPIPRVSPGAGPASVAGTTASTTYNTPSTSRTSSPSKRHADLPPPPPPSRRPTSTSATATTTTSGSSHNPFAQSQHTSHSHPQPPLHPSQRSESSKSIPSAAVAASTSQQQQQQQQQQHATHNPFVSHHRPPPPSAPLPQTHSQFQSQQQQPPVKSTRSDDGRIPPLPPRKPPPPPPPLPQTQGQGTLSSAGSHIVPLVPPPQHVSSRNRERVERSISPAKAGNARPVPHPPLPQPQPLGLSSHVTSTLMKQSLHASKVAQTMKKAEEMLEKERVMQVLKRSGGGSGNTHLSNQYQQLHSESPAKMYASSASASSNDERDRERGRERQAPPLPRRRTHTQTQAQAQYVYPDEGKEKTGRQRQRDQVPPPPSPPMSASSMEQVALAHVNPRARHSQSLSDPFGVNNPGANVGMSPFRSPADPLPSRLQQKQQQHSTLNTDYDSPHSPVSERVTEKEKEGGREGLYSRYSTPSGSSSTSSSRAGSRVRGQARSMSMSMGVGVGANHGAVDGQHQQQQQYPPPTHPDRKPPAHLGHDIAPGSSVNSSPSQNGMTNYPRVFRSRSMHQTSPSASPGKGSVPSGTTTLSGAGPSPAPPPPARRRRPESVQVLPGSSSNLNLYQAYQQYQPPPPHPPVSPGKTGFGLGRHATVSSSTPAAGRRRSSLSTAVPTGPWGRDGERDTDRGGDEYGYDTHSTPSTLHAANANANTNATDSPLSTIRRSIEPILDNLNNLNRSVAADFDRARYKAEAGLSRRGFVRDGAVGHVHVGKRGEEEREEEEGLMRAPTGAGGDRGRGRDRGRAGRVHPVTGDTDDGRPGMDVDSPSVDGSSGQEGDGSDEGDESERWRKSRGMGLGVGKVPARNVFDQRQEFLEKDNLKWPAGEGWKPL